MTYRNRVEWKPSCVPGNYISVCLNYVATYICTERGQGKYMVHAGNIRAKDRKQSNALTIGGLPQYC